MSAKKQRQLLERSLTWVSDNLYATNLDVPDEFVALWIFEDTDETQVRPAGFFFSVFAYGYMQYDLHAGALPPEAARTVPVSRLVEHFDRWQMKLALAEIHRHTRIQLDPLPLFAFPEDEEVRYWPRRGGADSSGYSQ